MKSICIKTNNQDFLDYIQAEITYTDLDDIYLSTNKFKNYKNIILHYKGKDDKAFIHEIASVLSLLVIDEFEEYLLKKIILKNYFYFDTIERKDILNICFDILADNLSEYFELKYSTLLSDFSEYLSEHKSIVLTGFINFRIKNYIEILEKLVDEAVNSFVLEKEYYEFISLLKLYINSQESNCNVIHLVYSVNNSILIDENKNIINYDDNILNAKYLSDITFSSNDYALNELLNLIPKKIYIHLVDNYIDEFVNTIALIFENKTEICTDCDICKIYKNNNSKKPIKK